MHPLDSVQGNSQAQKKSRQKVSPSWHFRITFVGCHGTPKAIHCELQSRVQNFFLSFSVSLRPNSFFKPFGQKSQEQASSYLHHGKICQLTSRNVYEIFITKIENWLCSIQYGVRKTSKNWGIIQNQNLDLSYLDKDSLVRKKNTLQFQKQNHKGENVIYYFYVPDILFLNFDT